MNEHSGNSGQLQQPGAAACLNEPFGDSEQLGTDARIGGDALVLTLKEMRARLTDVGSPARTAALDAAIAALVARQPSYVQGSDELRARTDGERAAYMEGLEEGKRIAARQPVGVEDGRFPGGFQEAIHYINTMGDAAGQLYAQAFGHEDDGSNTELELLQKVSRHLAESMFAPPAPEMSPDFTDTARAAIAWVLWHHQGGSSAFGQPLRYALGMGDHEELSAQQISEAKRYAELVGARTDDFKQTAPAAVPAPDLSRTIAQLNRMRIVLRNARAYVENFTCKSALPSIQQKMIGQIDEVLGALAHAWPTAMPGEGPLSGTYGAVLRPFVAMMERELHANAGKGDRPGWLSMDSNTALLEIYHHMGKLQRATKNADEPGIVEYAADVANMAMMLVDVCGLLPVDDATHPQPVAACVNINAMRYLYLRAQPVEGGPWGTPRIAIPSAERAGEFANGDDADAAIDAAIAAQQAKPEVGNG